MGVKAPFLFFIFCSIPIGVVRAGIPPFQLTQATSRPKRPENLTPDEKVKILFERGNSVAAVLQFIENVYYTHQNGSCRKTSLAEFSSHGFEWYLPSEFTNTYEKQMKSAVKTANILNHYFLTAPNDTQINHLFFYSLVKANVESDPSLTSSSIVLTSNSDEFFIPFTNRRNDGSIRTQNLGYLDRWSGNDWFWVLETGNYSELFGQNSSDLVVTTEDGYWTSPYIDCNFTTMWQITYSVPFFTRNDDELYFKGVVAVSLPISGVDIDQCDGDSHLTAFSSSHHCDFSTTQCVPTSGKGFRRGAYRCYCKPNFYQASAETQRRDYYEGEVIEEAFVENVLKKQNKFLNSFQCLPCRVGCHVCFGDQPCYVEYDLMLRSVVLCFQTFCSTLVVILTIVIFVLRKSPIFSSVMWVMHEAILIGALLLYQTVIIRYFEPSILTCMIEPWFRGLGFAVCYGSIVLKIYRILAEFQTRKAHRVCVRDKDLLKYLLGIITVVIGYLLAWTAVIIDNMTEGYSVIVHEQTPTGLKYDMCRGLWWDYVTEVGELLFLVFGAFLTYKVRNAKSDALHEKEVLCWSVYIEALVSLLMYTIRHVVWSNLLPDYIYLLYFLRCQCTVTIILFFIFAPKLWYHARPPEEYQAGLTSCGDVRDEAVKLQEGVQCTANGEIDVSEVNFTDMDPEEIRNELRKLYTQIHNMKQASMRKGNPHISRRRGGRKGTHRKFSLQTFHHRHKQSQHDQEITEISKTPEDSVASADGTTDNASIRQLDDSHNNAGTPTVTFKDDQK